MIFKMKRIFCNVGLSVSLVFVCGCSLDSATRYSPNYSDQRFQKIQTGMSELEVSNVLGAPISISTQNWSEVWSYFPSHLKQSSNQTEFRLGDTEDWTKLNFDSSGIVKGVKGQYLQGGLIGLSKQDIASRFGTPSQIETRDGLILYYYSAPKKPGDSFERRIIFFGADDKKVKKIEASKYHD